MDASRTMDDTAVRAVHRPVLLREAVLWLECGPGKRIADVTLGLGGHAQAILEACAPQGVLVGLDRDGEALIEARLKLSKVVASSQSRVLLHHADAKDLANVLSAEGIPAVDGVLMDLGISSWQLDSSERGFSFQADGPLDMRMDRRRSLTASMVVNSSSESELWEILRTFGEERWAKSIARAIVAVRTGRPITRTKELAEIVRTAIPARFRQTHPHPATRTFQALRIVVNRELEDLPSALNTALECLAPGGRLVVIGFHSLEDRLVKRTMKMWEKGCVCPPAFPICRCGRSPQARILTPRPITPSEAEIADNPRARSAKMRVAERATGLASIPAAGFQGATA